MWYNKCEKNGDEDMRNEINEIENVDNVDKEIEIALEDISKKDIAVLSKEERVSAALDRLRRSSKNGLCSGSELSEFLSKDNVAEVNKTLLMRTFAKERIKLLTEEQVREECSEYFLMCLENSVCPTITSLAVYLGMSINGLYTCASSPNCAFRDAINDSISICHTFIENGAINGKISVSLYQFLANNYFGLKSSQEISVVQTGQKNIDNQKTLKIIQEQLEEENSMVIDVKE